MSSSPGPAIIKVLEAWFERAFSPERRKFLLFSVATGALIAARTAGAQTIPVMYWQMAEDAMPAGVICGGPIADGPIGGPP